MKLDKLSDKELLSLAMMASGSPPRESPEYMRQYQRARKNIPKMTPQERYKLTRAQLEVYAVMRDIIGLNRPKK